jgi:hypothetical protein
MGEAAALRVAMELVHISSRIRHVRLRPLPNGTLVLLRIVAGEEDARERAIELTGRTGDEVHEAAAFFIEQILLSPDADSYRVLGASSEATCNELRRNMTLLLKWLHPDVQRQGGRSIFSRRVALAWGDLKTPERRAAYDEARRALQAGRQSQRESSAQSCQASSRPTPVPWTPDPIFPAQRSKAMIAAPQNGQSRPLLAIILRAITLGALTLFLIWQVITRSFAAYLAEVAPESAIRLREDEPTALVRLAQASLDASPEGEKEQSRAWTELALRNDPHNARALRLLGETEPNSANDARTSKLMLAAARRSLHESRAIYWLARQSFGREDFASTAYYADVLLRTRPEFNANLMPALARMAEHANGNHEIKKLLASNPPWRTQFFSALLDSMSDARTPLNLVMALKDTQAPPTDAELKLYINFLIEKKFYELAYYVWLQFLPPEQLGNMGLLFNGAFETTPSGLPFDWTITSGTGVTIDIVARPDQENRRSLLIEFGYGRVEFRPVTELIMLVPGAYRLKGAYKGEITGSRGLQWRVTCAGGAASPIGKSPLAIGVQRSWKAFELDFAVPNKDCGAQYISLALDARSASEQLVSGSIWYGELHIDRLEQGPRAR